LENNWINVVFNLKSYNKIMVKRDCGWSLLQPSSGRQIKPIHSILKSIAQVPGEGIRNTTIIIGGN